jgi:hypothetical protein
LSRIQKKANHWTNLESVSTFKLESKHQNTLPQPNPDHRSALDLEHFKVLNLKTKSIFEETAAALKDSIAVSEKMTELAARELENERESYMGEDDIQVPKRLHALQMEYDILSEIPNHPISLQEFNSELKPYLTEALSVQDKIEKEPIKYQQAMGNLVAMGLFGGAMDARLIAII